MEPLKVDTIFIVFVRKGTIFRVYFHRIVAGRTLISLVAIYVVFHVCCFVFLFHSISPAHVVSISPEYFAVSFSPACVVISISPALVVFFIWLQD